MTHKKLFKELDTLVNVFVKIRNGVVAKSVGRYTIYILIKKGVKLISDVLLVPVLDQNLLSVSQIVSY